MAYEYDNNIYTTTALFVRVLSLPLKRSLVCEYIYLNGCVWHIMHSHTHTITGLKIVCPIPLPHKGDWLDWFRFSFSRKQRLTSISPPPASNRFNTTCPHPQTRCPCFYTSKTTISLADDPSKCTATTTDLHLLLFTSQTPNLHKERTTPTPAPSEMLPHPAELLMGWAFPVPPLHRTHSTPCFIHLT